MKLSTTDLYIELIIIGLGPLIVIGLLASSIADYDLANLISQINATHLIILTIFSYILGIIWDTLLKTNGLWLFSESKQNIIKEMVYKKIYKEDNKDTSIDDLLKKGQESSYKIEHTAKHFEYSRSKLRICRGWSLNSIFIGITLVLSYGLHYRWSYLLAGSIILIGLLFSILFYRSWYLLTLKEYEKYLNGVPKEQNKPY